MGALASPAVPSSAAASRVERWAPAAGLVFAGLFVAAAIVAVAGIDTGTDKLLSVTSHFAHDDYQGKAGLVLVLVAASSLAFLWYLADLAAWARAATSGMLASLVPISGAVFILALVVGCGTFVAPLFGIGHTELLGADPKTEATVFQMLSSVGWGVMGVAGVSGGMMMIGSALIAGRTGELSRLVAAGVVVAAVIAIVGSIVAVFPMLLVVLWVALSSIRRTGMAMRRT